MSSSAIREEETKTRGVEKKREKKKSRAKKGFEKAQQNSSMAVNKQLPESPDGWARTVNHVIKNATPTRRSLLNKPCRSNSDNFNESAEKVAKLLEIKRLVILGNQVKMSKDNFSHHLMLKHC